MNGPAPQIAHSSAQGMPPIVIADAIAQAPSFWPAFQVGTSTFAAYVRDRLPTDGSSPPAAFAERVRDLYLTCACALGDPQAIATIERLYFDEVDAVAARLKNKGVRSDEIRQHVRERLFVGTSSVPPRITSYSGEGDLRNWLRVVAMRAALNMTRDDSGSRERDRADESALLQLPDLADDPELGFMKQLYRADDAAVSEAFGALSFRERNVLKFTITDNLTTQAIGAVYGVHRTTVARWLEEAQQALLGTIRSAMMRRLRVNRTELESILRLVRSRLELRLVERAAAC